MIKIIKKDLVIDEIEKNILSCKSLNIDDFEADYHHNTKYKVGIDIVKNGILSIEQQRKLNNKKLTLEERRKLNDDFHVNGYENISICKTNIDYSTIREDEFIYDFNLSESLDILISNNIFARRNSINYANEYLVYKRISPKKIKSIDIRLLNLMKKKVDVNSLISDYNYLRMIAIIILKYKRDILIREASSSIINLDIKSLSLLPKLVLENK